MSSASRWSNHCASPCKAPIRKPARRGSIFTAPPAPVNDEVADDMSSLSTDSMLYYVQQSRWAATIDQEPHDTEKTIHYPMRRLSLAKTAQPEVRVPVSDRETLERQAPWAATA